jgi:uncharacterized membrane protein
MFDAQDDCRAFERAEVKTGNRIAARIAIIATTTSNSMSVKAAAEVRFMTQSLSVCPERAGGTFDDAPRNPVGRSRLYRMNELTGGGKKPGECGGGTVHAPPLIWTRRRRATAEAVRWVGAEELRRGR